MRYVVAGSTLLMMLFMVVGCSETETVFREVPPYTDPPEGAGEFLGYNDADEKLTVCGNCHVGFQAKWEISGHADAWETLQSSGHAQVFCEGCHTVGPNGNPSEAGGYASAPEARYEDVQCESCHGEGLAHVMNPDASSPLASIAVSMDGLGSTCADCHTGSHHPFIEEWSQSKHANPDPYPAGREDCVACHTAQGALAAWGVTNNYLEKDAAVGEHEPIVCVVCHDPHSSEHPGQLRFALDGSSQENNLCIKCHHKRAEPEVDASTVRGPHSPEGPLVLGEKVGWWPDGFEPPNRIIGTHGSERNPSLCATCHVNKTTVNDAETGEFLLTSTGHIFNAIPCTDENGIPLIDEDCPDAERTFEACASSGCHGTPEVAMTAWQTASARIGDQVEALDALIAQLPEGELDRFDGVFTVADGAWFNSELAKLPGSSVHNPFLIEQLLRASITAVEDAYGVESTRTTLE